MRGVSPPGIQRIKARPDFGKELGRSIPRIGMLSGRKVEAGLFRAGCYAVALSERRPTPKSNYPLGDRGHSDHLQARDFTFGHDIVSESPRSPLREEGGTKPLGVHSPRDQPATAHAVVCSAVSEVSSRRRLDRRVNSSNVKWRFVPSRNRRTPHGQMRSISPSEQRRDRLLPLGFELLNSLRRSSPDSCASRAASWTPFFFRCYYIE